MRPTLKLPLLPACAALAACPAHSAYGPGGDERLESTLSESASTEGADAASLKCDELQKKLKAIRVEERGEKERLKILSEVFEGARTNMNKLDDAVAANPDLLYGTAGDQVKSNLEDCRSTFADVRSELDRSVRDIVDLPVIQELQGKSMVNVPRLDFAVLRSTITTLDPDDKDVLLSKVDAAEKKVGSGSEK
jgi:hypothetical protein